MNYSRSDYIVDID